MKKLLTVCMCLALLAVSAFADFARDAEFEALMNKQSQSTTGIMTPEQIPGYADDLRSAQLDAALSPLYEQILERKSNGQAADDLWEQVRAVRASLGFTDRNASNNLDQGGDNCFDAFDLGYAMGINVASGTTSGYASDFGPFPTAPDCWQGNLIGVNTFSGPDVTYLWTAPFNGTFTFSTCNANTDFDSGVMLYTPCSNTAGPIYLCGNDDACGLDAKLSCYPLQAGQQVLIVIDGWSANSVGNYQLDISCCYQCPPDAARSPEGDCGPEFVDINYGCPPPGTSIPPAFEQLDCNSTICATSGRWTDAAGQVHYDFDWYSITLTEQTYIRLCGRSDALGALVLYSGVCPALAFVDSVEFGSGCIPQCLSVCLDPGTYYVQAVLLANCGTPYSVTLACGTCGEDCDNSEPIFVDVSHGLPACQCITLPCPLTPYILCVGPLGPREVPYSATVTPGCPGIEITGLPILPCDEDCPPTTPLAISNWQYDPTNASWCILIGAFEAGCFCFCLDDVLPVELNEFDAIAGDGAVQLSWSTASESDNDHFDIERDGAIVGRVAATNAANGHSYTWTEHGLRNGQTYSYDLITVSLDGTREMVGTTAATPMATAATVTEYALHQNYPNPFNPETSISFDVAEAGLVTLQVYNPLGQVVATLVNGTLEAGRHQVSFDAATLPSGLYFYRMDAGEFSAIKKMVLMK